MAIIFFLLRVEGERVSLVPLVIARDGDGRDVSWCCRLQDNNCCNIVNNTIETVQRETILDDGRPGRTELEEGRTELEEGR